MTTSPLYQKDDLASDIAHLMDLAYMIFDKLTEINQQTLSTCDKLEVNQSLTLAWLAQDLAGRTLAKVEASKVI